MRRTLGVVCELCVVFSYYLSCHTLGVLRFDFIFGIHSFMGLLAVKGAGIKVRKEKVLRYYKARVYNAKLNQDPI